MALYDKASLVLIPSGTKEYTCSKCRITKPFSEFNKNKSKKIGINSYCRNCMVEYRIENKKKLNRYFKRYGEENREKISERSINRYRTDIQHNLAVSLRNRLYMALKRNAKCGSAVDDLGCSIKEFKKYLESKFVDGMTWKNKGRGGWHLDHIIPLSSFDLTNRDEFLKACHYTNIQPLWEEENLQKSNKI